MKQNLTKILLLREVNIARVTETKVVFKHDAWTKCNALCLVNLDNNNVFLEKLPNKIENDKSFVGYYAICKQSCHSCPYNAFLFCDDFFKS